MLSTKRIAHTVRYMPPTGGAHHKSQNQFVLRYYDTLCNRGRNTESREPGWVSHEANMHKKNKIERLHAIETTTEEHRKREGWSITKKVGADDEIVVSDNRET